MKSGNISILTCEFIYNLKQPFTGCFFYAIIRFFKFFSKKWLQNKNNDLTNMRQNAANILAAGAADARNFQSREEKHIIDF